MSGKRGSVARRLAAAVATLMLLAVPPAGADVPNPWTSWYEAITDPERPNKVEVPFLVIVTIAPMIAITPIWLGQLAVDAARGEDED